MPYCSPCNRYFESAKAIRQHRQDSHRHAYNLFPARRSASPVREFVPITTLSSAMPISGTQPTRDPAEDEPLKGLISSLKGLYSSGEYSDLVISCGGKKYHVHRAIVCTQSKFLAAACRIGLKEAQEGKIDLPDDDPRLVQIMVHYLYHFDYDVKPQYEGMGFDGSVTNRDETDANEPMRDVVVTHAKVYALAEKYLIRGLKAVALRRFKASAAHSWLGINDFLQAVHEVYTSTIEDDRGLRDIVVETLYKHSEWLDREEMRDVLRAFGALTYDLVIYMRQHGKL
ncbi:hypothetical protein N656DRAFT_785464 [Canariomyces notabilis]|uniref:BTB domain-containing protein n=1 Tax=Canariomyces notabilis TaxID=2074819 RepID=A0AAN6QFI7_9PEZI|nr:hypothetical protein N656DRAFT_785464 [Canariomyces arenarius]